MSLAQSISKRGFRKWYERELLVGHLHLVLLLLCTLALLGALEAFSEPGARRLLMAICVLLAAVIGLWALRRYFYLLLRAEHIANQAVCAQCAVYGRWTVEQQMPANDAAGAPARMQVCCRSCAARWTIDC